MVIELSREQARRIAVHPCVLTGARPTDLVDVVRQLTFVQLETTAPIAPTADLVFWSRLGPSYSPADLTAALEVDYSLFELNLLARPMEDLALFKAGMAEWPTRDSTRRWLDDNESFADDILFQLEEDGPLDAKAIPNSSIVSWPSSGWNNNRNVMMMLECLAAQGRIAVAARRGRDRLWDVAERVFHSDIPTVALDAALTIRNERRLRSQGIVSTTTPELPTEPTKVGDAGQPATIDGVRGVWRVDPDYLDEQFEGRTALLSPFDSLIRDRRRMELLFEIEYSLEMYKPAAKRRWGYYALPILHGDQLVGKVDASADHDRGRLVVHAVHEDDGFTPAVASAVDAELESLAAWLGLRLG